jgi:glycine C-acetyltransferase
MPLEALDKALELELEVLRIEGRAKPPERVIVGVIAPAGARGPRYRLKGSELEFIRMNSNSYLSLSLHPELIAAADEATRQFGVGPGAVRFIDGTFAHHAALEERVARFVGKPAAKIFNSAYTANCGLALTISSAATYWIGDQLNHNSIIRAMRIAGVPSANKAIYPHNDMAALARCRRSPRTWQRWWSYSTESSACGGLRAGRPDRGYRGLCGGRFKEGVVTVMDDSHGIGAFGPRGRGTADHTGALPDIVIGTFGKAFGVNGGFIAASRMVIEAVRQKADTYIYTNPLSVADCAAALRAVDLCDGPDGRSRLDHVQAMVVRFRRGIETLGWPSIPGPHPIVPLLVRDTPRTHALVQHLYNAGVLAVGLTSMSPGGPSLSDRAAHTEADIDHVLALATFTGARGVSFSFG